MWTSQTRQFGETEIGALEGMSVGGLTAALLRSDPVVALRGVTEVKLNGDATRLNALLGNAALTAHWRRYGSDDGVDAQDHEYARALEAVLAAL